MANIDILNYVQIARSSGAQNIDIKKNLLASGWQENDINAALNYVGDPQLFSAPSSLPQPTGFSQSQMGWIKKIAFVVNLYGRIVFWGFTIFCIAGLVYVYFILSALQKGFESMPTR